MAEEISYDKLREIQKVERSTGVITALAGDFYPSASRFISRLKSEMSSGFALEKAREYENAIKVLRDIHAIREQKIVLRAISAARGNNGVTGLTEEERVLFERVKDAITVGNSELEGLFGGIPASSPPPPSLLQLSSPVAPPQSIPPAGRSLKMLCPVPQFVGSSGAAHGPFKPGDVVVIPEKEAELLVKRKLAADA